MSDVVTKRDEEIQRQVIEELRWDSGIADTDVGVAVRDGIVTLAGVVGTYAERLAAQEAAYRVAGVRDVANEIRVAVPGRHRRTDEDLARAVRHALEWNVVIPADAVRSSVSEGWVRLEGTVGSWRERLDAESVVRYLPGIKGGVNAIAIAPPRVSTASLRRAIEAALERRAEREAKHLRVQVEDGTVTISGTVRTWREKQAILGTAAHAPGVRSVTDQLTIDPLT
jgi:osmotically-inducible protein OsmY